jgi:molybdenum cofactor sulfurtransferase
LKSSLPVSSVPINSLSLKEDEVLLSSIFVYPIKSCSGVRVDYWPVSRSGLKYDRYFAIIDNSNNKVITQKQYPMLALIQPSFLLERSNDEEILTLHISSPSLMESTLVVPLESITSPSPSSSSSLSSLSISSSFCEYNVCGRKVFGQKTSGNANEWFTEFLNKHNDSVRRNSEVDGDSTSHSHQKHDKLKSFSLIQYSSLSEITSSNCGLSVEDNKNDKETSSFANTSQYLLLSTESIQRLIHLMVESKELQQKDRSHEDFVKNIDKSHEDEQLYIRVENFRPNLVVSSCGKESASPHQEDFWKSVTVPLYSLSRSTFSSPTSLTLSVSGPCSRCSMVNVNGQSGIMSCKVFEALKEYRKVHNHVYFGQFLTFESISSAGCSNKEHNEDKVASVNEEVYYLVAGSVVNIKS